MWATAIAAIIVSSVQLLGYRQAMLGRDAVGRVQARWAARGGIEQAITIMTNHTEVPYPDDAYAMVNDLDIVATGDFEQRGTVVSSWDIRHDKDGRAWRGPADEHSKINVNATPEDPTLLLSFDDMTPDVVDAFGDWIDPDDEARAQGAEKYYYQGINTIPYEPRNAPMRSEGELELIAGIWPDKSRGEDYNLNGRLDANEDDGDRTWPPDDADGVLLFGWSGFLTTWSVRGGPAGSGEPRVNLRTADVEEVQERLSLDEETARSLKSFASDQSHRPEELLTAFARGPDAATGGAGSGSGTGGSGTGGSGTGGSGSGGSGSGGMGSGSGGTGSGASAFGSSGSGGSSRSGRGGRGGAGGAGGGGSSTSGGTGGAANQVNSVPVLSEEQLRTVLAEAAFEPSKPARVGKLNINTVSEELLRKIFFTRPQIVDEILFLRSRAQGIPSLVDLAEIPLFKDDTQSLEYVARIMDTSSNVFSICSRGRSWASGIEVEIVAVVDRSILPVRILEYREP